MIKGSCHCEQVKWTFEGEIDGVTACSCTACRRYGALWAYGYLEQEIKISGETKGYVRNSPNKVLGFHFCTNCGGMAYWLGRKLEPNGLYRIAVNFRLAEDPQQIAHYPIDHFDGFDKWEDLPRDGRCVKDMWF